MRLASNWDLGLALVTVGAIAGTISIHEAMHHLWGIPLPLDRTAIYFFPLFTLFVAALWVASDKSDYESSLCGRVTLGLLVISAGYFLGCTRLTYFKEWQFGANVSKVYDVLSYYNRTSGITKIAANWRYQTSLNCYLSWSATTRFDEVVPGGSAPAEYPSGFQAYVLYSPVDQSFISKQGLRIVYHDSFTEVTVAVPPDSQLPPWGK